VKQKNDELYIAVLAICLVVNRSTAVCVCVLPAACVCVLPAACVCVLHRAGYLASSCPALKMAG
jgi:hypothetical protein